MRAGLSGGQSVPKAGSSVGQESAGNNLAVWDKPSRHFGDSDSGSLNKWKSIVSADWQGTKSNATFSAVPGEVDPLLRFTAPGAGQQNGKHPDNEFRKLVIQLIENA